MKAIHIRRHRTDPKRRMMFVDVRAPRQLRRRHRPPRRMAPQRHVEPERTVRQRGRGRADPLRARQLGEAGLGAAEAVFVHVCGLGLGHVGLLSLGAFLGTAPADEDGEGEEGKGSGACCAYGDAGFGTRG